MISNLYRRQFNLVMKVLPYLAQFEEFALKGGTAINLFHSDLPRLSVDIDLTYLPLQQDRETALRGIEVVLTAFKQNLEEQIPSMRVSDSSISRGHELKLICRYNGTEIKVEVNPVMRGYLWEPVKMQVCQSVQQMFGLFASAKVISQGELYGGKICADLERQHPRDLFDIHILMNEKGIDEEIRLGFIATLLCCRKPLNEVLNPRFTDISSRFDGQFSGLSEHKFTYECFDKTRRDLVATIHRFLSIQDKAFLMSFKSGDPDWTLCPVAGIDSLPAVQWKLLNIQKLKQTNFKKHQAHLSKLKRCLQIDCMK